MKFRNIINKINWRLVLTHFVAIWLFSEAFQSFFYLSDVHLLGIIIDSRQRILNGETIINNSNGNEFANFYYYSTIGSIVGFLLGIIISLIITLRQKWVWLNTIIAILVMYFLGWLGLNTSYFLKAISLFPGVIIQNRITLTIILNSSILLFLGIFAFFLGKLMISFQNSKTSVV